MPKIVDKKQKRTLIAQKAMELFARKGFENTSIREITTTAGIGKGTLYDYFKDKEDILNEIADIMIEKWQVLFTSALEGKNTPQEKIRALMEMDDLATPEFEQMFFLYLDLGRMGSDGSRNLGFTDRFNGFLHDSLAVLTLLFEEGKQTGDFRENLDCQAMGMALLALVDGICFHKTIFKTDFDLKTVWSLFMDVVLRGISR